jgi:hypothetical protein
MSHSRSSDPLLDQVAEIARDEESDLWSDAAWEAMARGELSDEEIAALLARADEAGFPEAAEVFKPLGQRSEDRILSAIDSAREQRRLPDGVVELAVVERKREASRLFTILGGLAAAAALVLFVVFRPAPTAGELPGYELSIRGGTKEVRGVDDADRVRLHPGDTFVVSLRPVARTDEELGMQAYLLTAERALLLDATIESSEGGFLRARVVLPPDVRPSTEAEIAVLVGRPSALEGEPSREDLVRLADAGAPDVRVVRVRVEIGPHPIPQESER